MHKIPEVLTAESQYLVSMFRLLVNWRHSKCLNVLSRVVLFFATRSSYVSTRSAIFRPMRNNYLNYTTLHIYHLCELWKFQAVETASSRTLNTLIPRVECVYGTFPATPNLQARMNSHSMRVTVKWHADRPGSNIDEGSAVTERAANLCHHCDTASKRQMSVEQHSPTCLPTWDSRSSNWLLLPSSAVLSLNLRPDRCRCENKLSSGFE